MRSFRKDAKVGALILAAALALAQFVRIEKTNPSAGMGISADPAIKPLLKKACYNCHSNETAWPWYSNVAPVSWLIGSDVKEARRELNFSEWGSYAVSDRNDKLRRIAGEVEKGGMPPWYYSVMHRESRLTLQERNKIKDWTVAAEQPISK